MTASNSKGAAKNKKTQAAVRRSGARLVAVQALYELAISGAPTNEVLRRFIEDRWVEKESDAPHAPESSELDRDFLTQLVIGVTARQSDLDKIIGDALSEDWTIDRLETILKAILRAGAFELSPDRDVPPRVVINEYVDVAHAFFAANEPALVNAVLDRLARLLRTSEMEASESARQAENG